MTKTARWDHCWEAAASAQRKIKIKIMMPFSLCPKPICFDYSTSLGMLLYILSIKLIKHAKNINLNVLTIIRTLIKIKKEKRLTWTVDSSSPPSNLQAFLELSKLFHVPKSHPSVWPPKMHTPKSNLKGKSTPWVHWYFAIGASLGKYLKTFNSRFL